MTARISNTFFTDALKHVFGMGVISSVFSKVELYLGPLPSNPEVVLNPSDIGSWLAGGETGVHGGTPLLSTNRHNSEYWSLPSRGVTVLSTPINIMPAYNVGFDACFLRFSKNIGSGSETKGVLDILPSSIKSNQKARINAESFSGNIPQAILDLGFKLATSGDTCFNNALANSILRALLIKGDNIPNPVSGGYGYMGGIPSVYNSSGSYSDSPIVISAYDGAIPTSANREATGTLLWQATKSAVHYSEEDQIFNISGNSISLKNTFSGTVQSTGTPTYIRVRKTLIADVGNFYPTFEMQLSVGDQDNQASFNKTVFTVGDTAVLNEFTVSMLLQG